MADTRVSQTYNVGDEYVVPPNTWADILVIFKSGTTSYTIVPADSPSKPTTVIKSQATSMQTPYQLKSGDKINGFVADGVFICGTHIDVS